MRSDPNIKVIAPWREWEFKSRTDLIEFAEKNQILVTKDKRGEAPFSIDANLLHSSSEGKVLEDPNVEPPPYVFQRTVSPEEAPDKATVIEIGFSKGDAVSLDGKALSPATLLTRLNELGGANGIGRVDLVENRFVGMKSRGIYETPGGTILSVAHRAIESITLDRGAAHLKDELMPRYAELVYNGFWFAPEREMIQALADKSQAKVDGTVRLKLYKGNVIVIGRASAEFALFRRARHLRGRPRRLRPEGRGGLHKAQRAAPAHARDARQAEEDLTTLSVVVFVLVYLGMALGRVPGLAVDRTGVALLGLIVLLATGDLSLAEAGSAIDMPTIALLFALMILSAQFESSGFYGWVAERATHAAKNPKAVLAILVAVVGVLSALLTNDVIAVALTPLVAAGLMAQGLEARPYLVALAGAANAGSAATLIGNPQNILIGQASHIAFWPYVGFALPPADSGARGRLLCRRHDLARELRGRRAQASAPAEPTAPTRLNRFQLAKAVVAVVALVVLFLSPLPRELSALAVAGALLLSRRISSRAMIGAVDWHLLLLFVCLFGVTAAFAKTGLAADGLRWLTENGLLPDRLAVMSPLALAASNTIGNVPAVILILRLLPDLSDGALAGLALLSTFAGNLLLTGSLCNIIVAERAAVAGARLSFSDFARSGIPMTLASFAVTIVWLWLTGLMRM